jgi:dihydrofolate reductase
MEGPQLVRVNYARRILVRNDSLRADHYHCGMLGSYRIEGYAIISANGMIADASREMPPSIRYEADQRFLQNELDRAAALVHGRHSYEGSARAARRRRLIVTRRVPSTAPDPDNDLALFWNPTGAALETALAALGVGNGTIAIIGGTEVFGLFLPYYDAFHLSCATKARIPGGTPLFAQVAVGATPQQVLSQAELKAGPQRDLDAAAGVTLVTWQR